MKQTVVSKKIEDNRFFLKKIPLVLMSRFSEKTVTWPTILTSLKINLKEFLMEKWKIVL